MKMMKMMKMACKVFVLYCIYEIYWMASERPFIPHVVADCFLDISLVPSSDFLFWSPRLPLCNIWISDFAGIFVKYLKRGKICKIVKEWQQQIQHLFCWRGRHLIEPSPCIDNYQPAPQTLRPIGSGGWDYLRSKNGISTSKGRRCAATNNCINASMCLGASVWRLCWYFEVHVEV